MQVEYINPFISSMSNTFDTMLGCQIKRGQLTLADPNNNRSDVSGVIGLSGKAVGSVIVGFPEEIAIKAAAAMLMMEVSDFEGINEDVVDAIGEIANMVAGSAKAQLEEYELSISLPTVVVGNPTDIRFPSGTQPILVPFSSDWGEVSLKVGFTPVEVPV